MYIFRAKNLYKEWDGKALFTDVNLELKEGEHLAIFGSNGVGKTTLLNGLLNRFSFERGVVQRFVPLSEWGILAQSVGDSCEQSTLEFVQAAASERYRLKKRIGSLTKTIRREQRP